MLQVQCKHEAKDGQEVKHHDQFRCTITCGYCGKRRHYLDKCHIKLRKFGKLRKAEEERRRNADKGKPEERGHNSGRSPGKGNPCGGQTSSAPTTGGRGATKPTPKGEHPPEKQTVPTTPSASGAEKNENAKKRKLNWHFKCMQTAR